MKIQPRYYPSILIAAFVVFLLIGFLLASCPGRAKARVTEEAR